MISSTSEGTTVRGDACPACSGTLRLERSFSTIFFCGSCGRRFSGDTNQWIEIPSLPPVQNGWCGNDTI
jgi:ribosomal protein L37AE/L43A